MDENPYKAPAERHGPSRRVARRHPMIDPFWNRVVWAVLMMPFLIGFVISLSLWLFC
jgi:hypothetical protein